MIGGTETNRSLYYLHLEFNYIRNYYEIFENIKQALKKFEVIVLVIALISTTISLISTNWKIAMTAAISGFFVYISTLLIVKFYMRNRLEIKLYEYLLRLEIQVQESQKIFMKHSVDYDKIKEIERRLLSFCKEMAKSINDKKLLEQIIRLSLSIEKFRELRKYKIYNHKGEPKK